MHFLQSQVKTDHGEHPLELTLFNCATITPEIHPQSSDPPPTNIPRFSFVQSHSEYAFAPEKSNLANSVASASAAP
jgi:hypothetical protein